MIIYNYEEFFIDQITSDDKEMIVINDSGFRQFQMEHVKSDAVFPDLFRLSSEKCMYCIENTMQCVHRSDNLNRERLGNSAHIYVCRKCGWWQYIWDEYEKMGFSEFYIEQKYKSLLKSFDATKYETPLQVLNDEALKNSEVLYHLHHKKFEELVQWVFMSFYNCDVKHVGRSHDGGIDLIMIDSDDPIAIQVKRRQSAEAIEPVSQVREFLGAMIHKDYHKGIFVTTAERFSKGAIQFTEDILSDRKVGLFDLVDHDKFVSIFKLVNETHLFPWERLKLQKYENVYVNESVKWMQY